MKFIIGGIHRIDTEFDQREVSTGPAKDPQLAQLSSHERAMSDSQPLLRSNSESASPSFAQLVSDAVPDAIEIPAIHVAKATHSFISEFYKFIARGSVVDLTIGIVIGGAFGDVAKSLVDDVLSPFVGLVTGVR